MAAQAEPSGPDHEFGASQWGLGLGEEVSHELADHGACFVVGSFDARGERGDAAFGRARGNPGRAARPPGPGCGRRGWWLRSA